MMDLQRVRKVVLFYDNRLKQIAEPAEHPGSLSNDVVGETVQRAAHMRSLIARLVEMIDSEPHRREKIMRWYGFLQGSLWAMRFYTVDELKEHSRPDAPPPEVPNAVPADSADAGPCEHESVMPHFPEDAGSLPAAEIRRLYPRFEGMCPECGQRVILYASFKHYVAGDW